MKSLIISIFFVVLGSMISAQTANQIVIDTVTGNEIICGETTRDGLIKIGDWFNEGYSNYQPNNEIIKNLLELKSDLPNILVVLGTWCGDSKEHVPHFFKVIDDIGYPVDKIFMVAVDRSKKGGDFCLTDFDIQLVPTFIFTKNGEEIGRIIETPLTNVEQDMLDIIKGNDTSLN